MTTLFGLCAVLGGTVLVCQFLLTLLGFAADHDVDGFHADLSDADGGVTDLAADLGHEAHGGVGAHGAEPNAATIHDGPNWFFRMLTLRTVVAALTFFGLTGLAANANGAPPATVFAFAVLAGLGAMFAVHWAMQTLAGLRTDGTIGVADSVGLDAMVHVKIRGRDQGAGKILVNVQERTMELQARTRQDDIAAGEQVVVVRVLGPDTVEVERTHTAEVAHDSVADARPV